MNQRGQARLPDLELITIEFRSFLERFFNAELSEHCESLWVRKAGLPPLFCQPVKQDRVITQSTDRTKDSH
jgi:hypothetical protein